MVAKTMYYCQAIIGVLGVVKGLTVCWIHKNEWLLIEMGAL